MATGPRANQLAVFKALDEEMVHLFHDETPEALEKCDHIAKTLLKYAELPLGLRCRACIVLAGFDEPGYVEWAQEAARVADLALSQMANPTEAERALHRRAHECLDQAQEYFEEHGGYHHDQEQEEDEAENEDVKLVSSSTASVGSDGKVTTVVHKEPAANSSASADEEQLKKKKFGGARIDSYTGRVEIQDPETGVWETVDDKDVQFK